MRLSSRFRLVVLAVLASACRATTEDAPDNGEAGLIDAAPIDATTTEDAGTEASPDGAPLTGFCANVSPTPAFCDDFDDDDVDDDWTILTQNGGIGALNETSATSVPASFTVQTQELILAQTANVHLRTTAKGKPTRIRLAFNTYLSETTLTQGAIAIATLDVSNTHYFTLYLRDTDANTPAPTLEETVSGTTTRFVLAKTPPAKTWTRIAIDVDLAAGTAAVTYDNENVLDAKTIAKTPSDEPTIRIGAVYVHGPFPEYEARFDDVALSFP